MLPQPLSQQNATFITWACTRWQYRGYLMLFLNLPITTELRSCYHQFIVDTKDPAKLGAPNLSSILPHNQGLTSICQASEDSSSWMTTETSSCHVRPWAVTRICFGHAACQDQPHPPQIHLQGHCSQGRVLWPVFEDPRVALLQSRTYSWFSINLPLEKE